MPPVAYTHVIEDTAGNLYAVADLPGVDHAYRGVRVKRVKGGFVPFARYKAHLVRRAGTRIVADLPEAV